jgi:hypothetical protein
MRVLAGDELRECDLAALVTRRDFVLAIGDGELRGVAAAALLSADFAILSPDATLHIDTPQAWGAIAWRIRHRAFALYLGGTTTFDSGAAFEAGLCDAIGDGRDWLRGRSEIALDSAASLIRNLGGDVLERAEFARLFAARIPQEGLRAFLEKRRPRFENTL